MESNINMNIQDGQQFETVKGIIERHTAKALREVNHELVLSAWEVGGYISERIKSSEWGSQTVKQLSEYLRREKPKLRGYSQRRLYSMVEFYDCYTSTEFGACMQRWSQLDKTYDRFDIAVQSASTQKQESENQAEIILHPLGAKFKDIPELLLSATEATSTRRMKTMRVTSTDTKGTFKR